MATKEKINTPDLTEPLCSIVMATYRQSRFLKTALLSCLNQAYNNFEVIVVSVEGDDETKRVLEDFPLAFRWRTSEKADQVFQRNLGIEWACGKYITLFDSDDFMLANKLTSEVGTARVENALIVSSGFLITNEHLNIEDWFIPRQFSRERLLKSCIITDTCLVDREIYEEFGLFDMEYGECACFNHWLKVSEKYPDRIKTNPVPTFLYRRHREQRHLTLNKELQQRLRERVKDESLARKPCKPMEAES